MAETVQAVVTPQAEVVSAAEPTIRPEDIVLPSPSYWPIVLAFGFACITGGLALNIAITIVGLIITLVATVGWVIEPIHPGEHT